MASYVPAVQSGQHVYVSGQLPIAEGKLLATGKVGAGVSAEQAKDLAQRCALNALAAVDSLVGLENVVKVVKLTGFVASRARLHRSARRDQRRLRPVRRGLRRGGPARPQRRRGCRASPGRPGGDRTDRRGRLTRRHPRDLATSGPDESPEQGRIRGRHVQDRGAWRAGSYDRSHERARDGGGGGACRRAAALGVAAARAEPGPDDARRHQHLGAARGPGRAGSGRRPRAGRRGAPGPDRRARPDRADPDHPRPPRPHRGLRPAERTARRRARPRRRPGAHHRRRAAGRAGRTPRRLRAGDPAAGHPRAHRRLGLLPGRARRRAGGAHRRHHPRPGHHRGRPPGRPPRRLPDQPGAALRVHAGSRRCPGTARRWPTAPPPPTSTSPTVGPGSTRSGRRSPPAPARPPTVVAAVYADVDRSLWWAAEWSVRAQLEYLGVDTGESAPGVSGLEHT